jgi:hypothetical protein
MADVPADHRTLLKGEGSDLADASTAIASPAFPQHQHDFCRMDAQVSAEKSDLARRCSSLISSITTFDGAESEIQGLGITQQPMPMSMATVEGRSPIFPRISTKSPSINSSPQTPGSSKSLLSPDSMQPMSVRNKYGGQGWGPLQEEPEDPQDMSNMRKTFGNGSSIALSQLSERGGKAGNDEDFISTTPSCF